MLNESNNSWFLKKKVLAFIPKYYLFPFRKPEKWNLRKKKISSFFKKETTKNKGKE